MPISIDREQLAERLLELLRIDSPTGMTDDAVDHLQRVLSEIGVESARTNKGGLLGQLPGDPSGPPRAVTAHVDTLGAMVKTVKPNGRLRMTRLGGLVWPGVEGESCRVYTVDGRILQGSVLIDVASSHVHGKETIEQARDDDHMEVRLDEPTTSVDETLALGVRAGDFVAIDPKPVLAPNGYVRSRFLDDKAGVTALITAVDTMLRDGIPFTAPTRIHISNYEEVGHGAADLDGDLAELLAVDMAAVGEGQRSDEHHVTICAKDSGGPYHAGLTRRLRQLAAVNDIPHRVDIYPYYRSDGSAHWYGGGGARVALIGPGVDASHHYERTHLDALVATCQLLVAYLSEPS
jgi:putative aminopeptidase FrvX